MGVIIFESNYSISGDIVFIVMSTFVFLGSFKSLKYIKKNSYLERIYTKRLIYLFIYILMSMAIFLFVSSLISLVSKLF